MRILTLVVGSLLLAANVYAAAPDPVISRCDQPLMFGFGSWEGPKEAFSVKPDGIHISAKSARAARAWPA